MDMSEFTKRIWGILPCNLEEGPCMARFRNSTNPEEVLSALEEYVHLHEPEREVVIDNHLDGPVTKEAQEIDVSELLKKHHWYI